MLVALVIFHADPARGGAERYTADLAADLVRRGHDVTLLARDFADGPPVAQQIPLAARAPTRLGQYLRFLRSLDEHLESEPYDIVHAMLPVHRCDVYHPHAGIAAESVRAKLTNRLNRKRNRFAQVERKLLSGPNPPVVLCLSEYVKQTIRRHYDLPPQKLVTLFNAVDLEKFAPTPRPPRKADVPVTALMIAQDYQRKGLRQTLLAMARLGDPRLTLQVVGKQNPSMYRRLARRLGLQRRVEFHGPVADPRPLYQQADFFVLPTRHDPCSLVVLEALAMGVPVISTRFNGACEIMTDGTHGFVLSDPADIDALADSMRMMLDEPQRKRMAGACLALRPDLSHRRHVDRLIEIYRANAYNSA